MRYRDIAYRCPRRQAPACGNGSGSVAGTVIIGPDGQEKQRRGPQSQKAIDKRSFQKGATVQPERLDDRVRSGGDAGATPDNESGKTVDARTSELTERPSRAFVEGLGASQNGAFYDEQCTAGWDFLD